MPPQREIAPPDDATEERSSYSHDLSKNRLRRIVGWSLAVIAFVILGSGVWLVFRAIVVKNELEAAQILVRDVDDASPADMGGDLLENLAAIGEHAKAAASASDDLVWHAAEWLPIVGDNLRAVRLASESLDAVANDVGIPALAAVGQPGSAPPLALVGEIFATAAPRVGALADELTSLRSSTSLVEPVASGVRRVDRMMQAAAPLVRDVPALLGMDGPRNYLVVFQDTAEARALGGRIDAQTLVSIDHGSISIIGTPSAVRTAGAPVDAAIEAGTRALFGDALTNDVGAATSRPDFPTAARLIREFWQRDVGADRVDGVISIDAQALAQFLAVTGPLSVDGTELTAENAATALLSDVHARWSSRGSEDVAAIHEFYTGAVAQLLSALSGRFPAEAALEAVSVAVSGGHLLVWLEDPVMADLLKGQRLEGVLPTSNTASTTIGVFVRDASSSKLDYYLDTGVHVAEACTADVRSFTTTTLLTLALTQPEADALPATVVSDQWGATQFRTEVFVYGPPGTKLDHVSVEGRELRPTSTTFDDLGRPVAAFETIIRPSESAKVIAVFSGAGDFGPVDVRTTPTPRPASISITSSCR